MGAAGLPCAMETAGPTVTLAVGSSPSQELVEGSLDDVGLYGGQASLQGLECLCLA